MRFPAPPLDPGEQPARQEAPQPEQLRMTVPPPCAAGSSSKAGASTSPTSVMRPSLLQSAFQPGAGAAATPWAALRNEVGSAPLNVGQQGVAVEQDGAAELMADAHPLSNANSLPISGNPSRPSSSTIEPSRMTIPMLGPRRPSPSPRMCDACGDSQALRGKPFTPGCNHDPSLCGECVAQWIEAEVGQGAAGGVRCPTLCGGVFEYADVGKHASPPVFERFERLMLNRAMEQDGEFRWCARPGCGNGQSTSGGADVSYMTCNVCRAKTCLMHRCVWHEGLTCPEYDAQQAAIAERRNAEQEDEEARQITDLKAQRRRLQDELTVCESRKRKREEDDEEDEHRARKRLQIANIDKEVEELEEKRKKTAEAASLEEMKKYKRCPKCSRAISKIIGCDHMTCRCKHEFCIRCLAPYGGANGIHKMGPAAHEKTCKHYREVDLMAARRRRHRQARARVANRRGRGGRGRARQLLDDRHTVETRAANNPTTAANEAWRSEFPGSRRQLVVDFVLRKLVAMHSQQHTNVLRITANHWEDHSFRIANSRNTYLGSIGALVSREQQRVLGRSDANIDAVHAAASAAGAATAATATGAAAAAALAGAAAAAGASAATGASASRVSPVTPLLNTSSNDPNFTAPRGHPDFVPVMNPQRSASCVFSLGTRNTPVLPELRPRPTVHGSGTGPILPPQTQLGIAHSQTVRLSGPASTAPTQNRQHRVPSLSSDARNSPQPPGSRPRPNSRGSNAGTNLASPNQPNNAPTQRTLLPGSASAASTENPVLFSAAQEFCRNWLSFLRRIQPHINIFLGAAPDIPYDTSRQRYSGVLAIIRFGLRGGDSGDLTMNHINFANDFMRTFSGWFEFHYPHLMNENEDEIQPRGSSSNMPSSASISDDASVGV